MSWEGQGPIRLCESCVAKAKAMLNGRYYYLRPLRVARELSDTDKEVLSRLSSSSFMRPDQVGSTEKQLLGLVMQGVAVMTRCDNHMQFRKVTL